MKKIRSFRLEKESIEQLEAKGINLTRLFDSTMEKLLKIKKCPTCHQIIKKK